MKRFDLEQQTPEWQSIRLGKPTASSFDKIITLAGEKSKQREKYMYQLAGEIITGQKEETYQNAAMERGCELEEEARNLYQIVKDCTVEKVGFCSDDLEQYGCSSDGFVGDDGLVEIKCPTMAVHVSYILGQKLPADYHQQVMGQLLVTGRKWCDFVSYYPAMKLFIVKVYRDEVFINKLREELELFCKELKNVVEKIK